MREVALHAAGEEVCGGEGEDGAGELWGAGEGGQCGSLGGGEGG